jgi:ABC-2 type transport system ATP-binding protein
MTEHADRAVRGYSKGMRQRIKLAQALVHDPQVLFLDEPLSGTDPLARHELADLIMELAKSGRTIVVSSHVLHEVESITRQVVLMNRGRLVAFGDVRQVRDLIDAHPHRIVLKSPESRALAAKLVRCDDVVGVELSRGGGSLVIETHAPDQFYGRLPGLALQGDTPIEEVYSDDDNLEAVFKYLVNP